VEGRNNESHERRNWHTTCRGLVRRNTVTLKKRPRLGCRLRSIQNAPDARPRNTAKARLETAKVMVGASKAKELLRSLVVLRRAACGDCLGLGPMGQVNFTRVCCFRAAICVDA